MTQQDKRAVRKLHNSNFTKKYIRSLFNISKEELHTILHTKENSRYNTSRNSDMYHTQIAHDMSYAQLGRQFKVSQQRAYQIIQEYKKRAVHNS